MKFIAWYLLPDIYCLVLIAWYLLHGTYCLVFIVWYLLPGIYCLVLIPGTYCLIPFAISIGCTSNNDTKLKIKQSHALHYN